MTTIRHGIRISAPGKNALTARNFERLLDERFPLFKVHMEGESSVFLPSAASLNNQIIYHNLGYIPAIFVYGELQAGSGRRYLINGRNPYLSPSAGDEVFMYAYANTTQLVVEVDSLAPLGVNKYFAFHYYISFDQLNV